jgi:hypothetical protein
LFIIGLDIVSQLNTFGNLTAKITKHIIRINTIPFIIKKICNERFARIFGIVTIKILINNADKIKNVNI